MEANVGGSERSLRIIVGLILVDLGLGGVAGAWAWLALVPLLTGAAAWCPLRALLGTSSAPADPGDTSPAALREAIALHGHSTVRPRILPARSSSRA